MIQVFRVRIFMVIVVGLSVALMMTFGWPGKKTIAGDKSPAEWGSDHVGQEVPEFTTGGECLFCHRGSFASDWQKSPHNKTVRDVSADDPALASLRSIAESTAVADEVQFLLGRKQHVRFLKRIEGYGKAAILDSHATHSERWTIEGAHKWDETLFNESCAGCHASAVDPESAGFGALGLDCYVCHGVIDVDSHIAEPQGVLLNARQPTDARVGVAICGQCHFRGGKSKSSKRPYPNNFVAGDNLLLDFNVDLSPDIEKNLDRVERHIVASAREVLKNGKENLACVSCHAVHLPSTKKHEALEETEYCAICHEPGKAMSDVQMPKQRHSKTCQY